MKKYNAVTWLLLAMGFVAFAFGQEATLAEWDFRVRQDATVDGGLTGGFVRGKSSIVDGWLVIPDGTGQTEPQGFQVAREVRPELAPQSGFRVEVTAKLRANDGEIDTTPQTLLDTKYYMDNGPQSREPAFHGFLFSIARRADGQARYRLGLGFEKDSVMIETPFFAVTPGQEQTFAFSYDGVENVNFWLDGKPVHTRRLKSPGPIQPAVHPTVIGDRFGANHNPWRGSIQKVTITTFPSPQLFMHVFGRHAFVRGEQDAKVLVRLRAAKNIQAGATLTLSLPEATELEPQTVTLLEPLRVNEEIEVPVPFHPDYPVGQYTAFFHFSGETTDGSFVRQRFEDKLVIGPQQAQDDFPIILWSGGLPLETLLEHDMTHELHWFMHFLLKYGKESLQQQTDIHLDEAVEKGARFVNQFSVRDYFAKDYPRKRLDGSEVANSVEAADPSFQDKTVQAAIDFCEITSDHPGLDAILLNSEVRDHSVPSLGFSDPATYTKFTGKQAPDGIAAKDGVSWKSLPNFPLDRVVPYNHPLLDYYRWFWTDGEGWNVVQSRATEAIHQHRKHPTWTWFDPAVRVPPLWGSGGKVDVISQWTYAYPDPLRTGGATDELFAMAAGRPGQKVMSMTQFICYRNQVAPIEVKVSPEPTWLKGNETAAFVSIPPDSLTEATWAIIARPVQGIMYHGSNSVFGESEAYYKAKGGNEHSHAFYCTTNPDTKVALKNVLHNVVKPLGPTLKRIPARKPEVVILESFASAMFAKRGSWGWGEDWISHIHLVFSWANLAPEFYYEETVLRDGLDGVKVLGLFHCDVLTEPVVAKIQEWQRNGGIVVADGNLAPAILPDIVLPEIPYVRENDKNKADLQGLSKELRKQLDPYYRSYTTADNYDIVTRTRTYKDADYIFALNDKRAYGDYIGPWKKSMEKGMPNSGKLSINRPCAVVYDLVSHSTVPFEVKKGVTTIPVKYETNDGKLLLLLDEPVAKVKLDVPATVPAAIEQTLRVEVLSRAGKPIAALFPIEVTITDETGNVLDGSGYSCAVDGVLNWRFTLPLGTPRNSAYTIQVTDLASGKIATAKVKHN